MPLHSTEKCTCVHVHACVRVCMCKRLRTGEIVVILHMYVSTDLLISPSIAFSGTNANFLHFSNIITFVLAKKKTTLNAISYRIPA